MISIKEIFDISKPLAEGVEVYDGDVPFERWLRFDAGGIVVSALSMSSHAGTHIDAPSHYGLGLTVDSIPLLDICGQAAVIEARDIQMTLEKSVPKRLLLKGEVKISPFQVRALASGGCRLLGVEGLTAGDDEVHRGLLGAGCIILENIELSAVPAGDYTLMCLPLRVLGAEGAPARAVLIN